jgi:hypothetical protein
VLDQMQVFGAGEGVGIVGEEEVLKLLKVFKGGGGGVWEDEKEGGRVRVEVKGVCGVAG